MSVSLTRIQRPDGTVYATQVSYEAFLKDISAWSQKIHEEVTDGIFEIWFNKTMITQGGGRENIMLKRIKDGTVLAVVFFGSRDDVMGSPNVTPELLERKFNELFREPGALFDIIISQAKGHFNKTKVKYDLKTGKAKEKVLKNAESQKKH